MSEWEPSIETTTSFVRREPFADAVIIELRWIQQDNGLDHLCPFVSVMVKNEDMADTMRSYAQAVLRELPMLYDKRESQSSKANTETTK